jgi:hypothetical protein
MTINDLRLSELLTKIHLNDACLSTFCRNNKEQALFNALMEIEEAARKGQERLNELKYGKDFVPPVEMMGT